MNFGLDNFCPITDDTDELLKKASTIDTSSFSISEQISKIKIYLQKPSCENRKLAEKQLDTLEEINKYYEIYKNETFTKKTNIELKKLFKAIDKNKYIGDFNGLSEKIDLRLNSELTRLRDTYIFETDTFRDNVEKNINFVGEYIEKEEINLFLKYFTVEYINFLDFNKITYPGLESSKIILNPNDLTKVLNKVKFRMKNIDYDFELKINLKEGLEKAVNLKNISQKVKIVKRSEKKQDSDKKIKKAEKNTQINLEFNNILEENIIEKINKYTEYLYKNPTLKKYYKTSVIGIYPKISRADYVRKIFSEINNVEGGVEDIPKGIKEEFLKIISGLPAQESKYDNSALNPNSGAFGIFQFTNINLIDSIKSGRLSKCPFLNIEEINQINILIKLDKSKIQENPLFKKLKKTFKSSMKKITWASASYFKVLYRKLTKITKGEHSSFITTDRKILSDLIERYNLSEKEKNKFIVYMMVNGYNTGGERINILLSEFSKNNEPKYNKNTALSLLEEITTFGKKQKASLTDYDKDSSEYVWKIIAGNKAVEKLEVEENQSKVSNISFNKPIYTSNFSSRTVPFMIFSKKHGFEYKIVKNLNEAKKLSKGKKPYLKLYTKNDFSNIPLILDGIGKPNGVNSKYLYFNENAFSTLKEIAEKINNELKFKIRITSAFRPAIYNNKIQGSSKSSPHQSGLGFDISLKRERDVFKILKDFDIHGKIILTKESDHFHITVTDPNIRRLIF